MRPSIVFGILSAAHRPETLLQLVEALADYPVVIHHDFTQQPDFSIDAPNVTFVADYASSGWASWGLMDSIARTIDFCGQHYDYDYLQFLTPVDLPIKPLTRFESFISSDSHDVAVDQLALDQDELVFMTFAFRAYAAQDSLAYRILWRARELYFGADYETNVRGGLSVPLDAVRDPSGGLKMSARLGRSITRAYVSLVTRFGSELMGMPVYAGSVWFGAKRQACEYLVERMQEPVVQARFKPLFCAPEMLISSIFAESEFNCRPGNHLINTFEGARPLWFGVQDLESIVQSECFFGRKFPDDPSAPVRAMVLGNVNDGLDVGFAA